MSKHSSACQETRNEEHTLLRDTSIRTSQAHNTFRSDPADREAAVAGVRAAPPPMVQKRGARTPMTATHQDLPLSGYSGVAAASATARPSSSETRRGRTVESGRHRGRRREGRPRPPRLSFHAILTSLSTNTEAALHDLQHMDCLRETTFGKNKGLKFIIYFCQSKPHKEKNKLFRRINM